VPSGLVVDVVDDTGQAGVADRARADLRAGGVTVHSVSSGTGTPDSGIAYPAERRDAAQQFADALTASDYLRRSDVERITVVLGPGDAAALLTALDRFAAC
jgi:hypothetical protein